MVRKEWQYVRGGAASVEGKFLKGELKLWFAGGLSSDGGRLGVGDANRRN